MHVKTGIKVRGWIRIQTIDHTTGQVTLVYDGPNLIVDSGLTVLGELLTQDGAPQDPADRRIVTIQFGDGTATPAAGDTALDGGSTFSSTITTYTNDIGGTAGLIGFETTLGTGQYNGNTIAEVGLLTSAGTLFARQLTPLIAKTNLISVAVDWRVQFSDV